MNERSLMFNPILLRYPSAMFKDCVSWKRSFLERYRQLVVWLEETIDEAFVKAATNAQQNRGRRTRIEDHIRRVGRGK